MTAAGEHSAPGAAAPALPVLAVAGLGLIGGSFALALRQAGMVSRVLGVGRQASTLARARDLGLIDCAVSAADAAAEADLILLAAPVGALGGILAEMGPALRADGVITDAGSTKMEVIAQARAALGHRIGQFVPGHPIAGGERTGPEAALADLYRGRAVILTPLPENTAPAIAMVRRAWEACGACVEEMEAAAHDCALASISHLPHLLASTYVVQVAQSADASRRLRLAGSGFRDFTRIAAGSPEMWRDIFIHNRDAMLAELAAMRNVLNDAEQAIAAGDGHNLQRMLEQAADVRRNWRQEQSE
jgi:prephenate dehydrogenase